MLKRNRKYLEVDVVTDEDVAFHEVLLVRAIFRDHREGMINGGAQDADKRLDPGMGIHVSEVGLHYVTSSQPEMDDATETSTQKSHLWFINHSLVDARF